jgi:hypothetical protein
MLCDCRTQCGTCIQLLHTPLVQYQIGGWWSAVDSRQNAAVRLPFAAPLSGSRHLNMFNQSLLSHHPELSLRAKVQVGDRWAPSLSLMGERRSVLQGGALHHRL